MLDNVHDTHSSILKNTELWNTFSNSIFCILYYVQCSLVGIFYVYRGIRIKYVTIYHKCPDYYAIIILRLVFIQKARKTIDTRLKVLRIIIIVITYYVETD